MAIIKCQECGKEISDKASACPNCGCPLEKSMVIVYGYPQAFMISPKVSIFLDDNEVGSVTNTGSVEIPIDKDSEIKFKSGFCSAKITVPFGKVTKIKIVWNRITGQLIPQIIDSLV